MILVIGDILRPHVDGTCHQIHNINWLYGEIKKKYPGAEVLLPETPLSFEDWYETDKQNTNSILLDKIKEKDPLLVIGFEIPTNVLKYLFTYNISYIDVNIHPIRFMKERIIGITTNIDTKWPIVQESDMYLSAEQYTSYTLHQPYWLFVGQTSIDRSLLKNGELLKVEQFEPILRGFKNLIYRPHPLDLNHNVEFFNYIGVSRIDTSTSTYELMANENCLGVIGISSSCLYEAKYFKKPAIFLTEREYHGKLIPVYESNFWSCI